MNVSNALKPHLIRPEHLDPHWRWDREIPALGHTSVDFERRVDHDRLRNYRLSRAKAALKESQCGALLFFDVNNIRYVTATKIGEWERDKMCRFALLAGDEEPYVWDFGSAGAITSSTATGSIPTIAARAWSACAARSRRRSAS